MEKQKNNLLFWNREVCQRAWALNRRQGHGYEKPVIKSWTKQGQKGMKGDRPTKGKPKGKTPPKGRKAKEALGHNTGQPRISGGSPTAETTTSRRAAQANVGDHTTAQSRRQLDLQCRTDGALPGGVPKPPPSLTVPNRGRWQPRR